jgi:SSS family solute:Na+ symporter
MAMAVTMLGPADALALSQKGIEYGLVWCIFPVGAALAQLTTGRLFAGRIKSSYGSIKSIGDIFVQKCGKSSGIIVGFFAFILAIAFSGVLILAGGQILYSFLGINKVFGMVLTAFIVGTYTAYNGMIDVMKTDRFQGILMGGMLLLLVGSMIYIGMSREIMISEVVIKENFYSEYNVFMIITMFLTYFFGELLLPPYLMRASVSKDEGAASRGFTLACFFLIGWYAIITLAGSIGNSILPDSQKSEDLILVSVARFFSQEHSFLHSLIGAFMFLGLISLIHSTFDSFLNNGAVSFSKDIVGNITTLDEKQELWLSQQATIAISFLGLVIAIWKNDLIDILFIGYTIWVPTILASLIWILYNKDKKLLQLSFWLGLVLGVTGWWLFEYMIKDTFPAIVAGLLVNFITIILIQRYKMRLKF